MKPFSFSILMLQLFQSFTILFIFQNGCQGAYNVYLSTLIIDNRFGPPSRYWCMRFEAKHSYFKSLAQRVKCFKNIAKTLADHQQNLMCYYASTNSCFSRDWLFGRIKLDITAIILHKTCLFYEKYHG